MTKPGEDPNKEPSEIILEGTEESPPESPENPKSSLSPDGEPSGEPQDEVIPAEGAEVFRHPLLKGKSPEEIEALVTAQQEATISQSTELNRYHTRVQELEGAQPAAPPPEEASPYGDGFMAEGFDALETRLKSAMDKMVEPLRAEMRAGKTSSAREIMRSKFKKFALLEPTIDGLLREQKVDPATVDERLLENLYYTALGAATDRGINLEQAGTPTEEAPMNIPQHRPSNAPLPEAPKAAVRALTEQEKRLAHIQFPTHEDPEGEYRRMQDIEDDEVVEPGFSKEWR